MKIRLRSRFLCGLALGLLPAVASAADPVQTILDKNELQGAYNPVLLGFLLEEGQQVLPEKQRKAAVDQLVAGLQANLKMDKGGQVALGLVTAGALLLGGDAGDVLSEVSSEVWGSQLESALILAKAGYTEPAVAFFEHCIQVFPDAQIQARCVAELAAARPEQAYDILMKMADKGDTIEIQQVALRLLGDLAAAPGATQQQKDAILEQLADKSKGMMNSTYYKDAAIGLVRSGDPRAVEPLKGLTKGMLKDKDASRVAQRGLLLSFKDRSQIESLQKAVKKGGMFSTKDASDTYFAGSLLIEAGEDAGHAWAMEQMTPKKKKKGLGKLVSLGGGKDEEPNFSADIVRLLVHTGGDKARQTLQSAIALPNQDEWLRAWIAIGLLELGDKTHIDLVRSSLTQYQFTALRAATALAKHGDHSGIAALRGLSELTVQSDKAEAVLSFLAGQGGQYRADKAAQERHLANLRRQIADALAEIDHDDAVPVLVRLLDDKFDSVRVSAAYALARMKAPAAIDGLARAVAVDYGKLEDGASRNPQVRAHVVRCAARGFKAGAQGLLKDCSGAPDVSVRFLALASIGKGR